MKNITIYHKELSEVEINNHMAIWPSNHIHISRKHLHCHTYSIILTVARNQRNLHVNRGWVDESNAHLYNGIKSWPLWQQDGDEWIETVAYKWNKGKVDVMEKNAGYLKLRTITWRKSRKFYQWVLIYHLETF